MLFRGVLVPLVVLGAILWCGTVRADAAAWVYAGGGGATLNGTRAGAPSGVLQLDLGMGTSPENRFVLGGLMRSLSFFGNGTDLSILQRTATRGYALGNWGVALDLGIYQRWWGTDSSGVAATLNGGGPWGTTLSATAQLGSGDATTLLVTLGIDWTRLTSHRGSGQTWWPQIRLPLPNSVETDPAPMTVPAAAVY